jgi:hypothetical protein
MFVRGRDAIWVVIITPRCQTHEVYEIAQQIDEVTAADETARRHRERLQCLIAHTRRHRTYAEHSRPQPTLTSSTIRPTENLSRKSFTRP